MFNKDFDKSLWFILEYDKENRKEIIEFLKKIPEELRNYIKETLNQNKEFNDEIYYKKSLPYDDGTIFSFELKCLDDEKTLIITEELATPESKTNYLNFITELTLIVENTTNYLLDGDEEIYLGNFTHTFEIHTKNIPSSIKHKNFIPFIDISKDKISASGYMKEQEIEYNLYRNEQGIVLIKSILGSSSDYIPVDLSELPIEINMEYIEKRYEESGLTLKP